MSGLVCRWMPFENGGVSAAGSRRATSDEGVSQSLLKPGKNPRCRKADGWIS